MKSSLLIVQIESIKQQIAELEAKLSSIKRAARNAKGDDIEAVQKFADVIDKLKENLLNDVDLNLGISRFPTAKFSVFSHDDEFDLEEYQTLKGVRKLLPGNTSEFFRQEFDLKAGILPFSTESNKELCKIHPLSLFAQLWYSLYRIWIIFYAIMLPLGISFLHKEGYLISLSVVMALFITVDTFIKFNTGMVQDQELEMDRSIVRNHIFQSKLIWKNVLIGFPYVIITQAVTENGSKERILSNLVVMINAIQVPRNFLGIDTAILSESIKLLIIKYEINSSLVTLMYILAAMFVYWHWFACSVTFLYPFGVILPVLEFQKDIDRYVFEVFNNVIIMLSSGYSLVPPQITPDRISKVFNSVFSAILLGLYTGNIANYMLRLDNSGQQFEQKLEEADKYVAENDLGDDIKDRIYEFYRLKYDHGKYFDRKRILAELNDSLRVVIIEINQGYCNDTMFWVGC